MDQIQALIDILKDTPEMALWGIGIFLSWKLLTMGSIVGSIAYVAKLFINRYFDNKESSRIRAVELENESKRLDLEQTKLNDIIALFDESYIMESAKQDIPRLLNLCRRGNSAYIHGSHITEIITIIQEARKSK
jgi:hypothetical protein